MASGAGCCNRCSGGPFSTSVNLSDSTAFHAERPQLSDRSRRLRFFSGACRWLGINLRCCWRCCDRIGWGGALQNLLILPYAVAPAVAGVNVCFSPSLGVVAMQLGRSSASTGTICSALAAAPQSSWRRSGRKSPTTSCFFQAGLQSIPRSLIERPLTAPLALLDNQFHFNCHKPRFSCSRHQCGLCFSTPLPSLMPPCKAVGTEQLFGLPRLLYYDGFKAMDPQKLGAVSRADER
jgi:hypothetical protein